MRSRIVLVHPAIQPYREELFKLLGTELGVEFIFIGWLNHNRREAKKAGLEHWRVLTDQAVFPYSHGVNLHLARLALEGKYDIWLTSTLHWFPTHLAFPLVKARSRKFVIWAEDWWWPAGMRSAIATPIIRTILRNADRCIVAGSRSKEFFLSNGAKLENLFSAINATSDISLFEPGLDSIPVLRKSHGIPERAFVFLYLNRVVHYKGLDLVISAFSKLERKFRHAWLVVVGDGPLLRSLKELAVSIGVTNIQFVGAVSHLETRAFYELADVYVHPARYVNDAHIKGEAWGFTINEAMNMGRAVIASSAVAAADDLIQNGTTGFVYQAQDFHALHDRMEELIRNPSLAHAMGVAGKALIQKYTPREQFKVFKAAIESLG